MANSSLFSLLIAFCLAAFAVGECPNACSAHGKCGAYDMCTCYRNWMANDCSERICQFGIAHVDSPKGDLDSSGGALSGPDTKVVLNDQIWPYGTTELYPEVTDMNGNVLSNTAHEYRECSNKGICDRQTGTCACFEGYEGSACQRASCPSNANGVCSGHGTCQSIKEIAWKDFNNVYELWDQDATMGCVCDGGYTGPDCSERQCKVGVDPLYYDNNATARFANWTYQFYTMTSGAAIIGNYSLIFTDAHNQEWETEPIPYGASCATLATYLESLPNNVIPQNSVRCNSYTLTNTGYSHGQKSGVDPIVDTNMYVDLKYTIVFPSNPGRLAQIRINKYLDGNRPTLYTNEDTTSTLGWHIYPNGYTGEYVDLVPDRCFDVMVTVNAGTSTTGDNSPYTNYLGSLTGEEAKLLKTCLGDADGNSANNVEVYNWDYGSAYNPHLIKLQDATQYVPSLRTEIDATTGVYDLTSYDPTLYPVPTSYICANADINANLYGSNQCSNKNPPGFYAVLFYDNQLLNPFRLFTNPANNYGSTTQFYVYTTTGYLNLVNTHSSVFTDRWTYSNALTVASHYSNVLGVIPDIDTQYATVASSNPMQGFSGDMSCDVTPIGTYEARDCFNKGDWALFINTRNQSTTQQSANPVFPNLYKIAKLYTNQKMLNNTLYPEPEEPIGRIRIVLDYSMNAQFRNTADGASGGGGAGDSTAQAYKFHPPTTATGYPRGGRVYASQCSGRGLCNTDSGVCECFGGYTGDDCSCQFAQAQ